MVAHVSSNLITTSPETLRAVALAGTGVMLLPSFAIFDLLASGGLVPLLPDYQAPEFEIVALHPHRRHMTAKVRAFIDMLVERFVDEQRQLGHPSD
jgi:DNA-binding transcriptional LysR family regulator